MSAALPKLTRAQVQVSRIGVLTLEGPATRLLEQALQQRGWAVGQNLKIEYRIYNGDTDLAHRYARELISLKPDALYAVTNTSMAALQLEGSTIPTVFAMVSDPVGKHYVDSFARPGRNVTGFTPFVPSLGGKWSYGVDINQIFVGAATYIDRILRGANQPNCQFKSQPNSSWSSIRKQQGNSACACRRRCSPALTR
ncbi:ABC transporter substrate binding protein [Bradyrhizobium iriomotense]|uniref:ABC transporter substrate binding protein n=1 Tax=Bradyrhizobium iriomotense TaxID=441950 RepID=UPI0024E0808A|nr:ABC transporter substrate binding protein [Bradyrhizobium iriomotense]